MIQEMPKIIKDKTNAQENPNILYTLLHEIRGIFDQYVTNVT